MFALLFLCILSLSISFDTDKFNRLTIYQVMVSSFQDGDSSLGYCIGYGPSHHCGDLVGIKNALEYIKGLNVNALWMTPVFNSNGNSQLDSTGYFAYDYFNVDPKFGSNELLKELINKAHSLGLYVFLDGVFGHHKEGNVAASPSGKYPDGGSNPVKYPGSLDFYKEVATYWIDKYEIDGWRLDQADQVTTRMQDKNYWTDIREAIENLCDQRKSQGKQWGTLGYMVGEIWNSADNIINWGYYGHDGKYGLRSTFHFPGRYDLVRTFACEESGDGGRDAGNLANIFNYNYPNFAYPNLFIGNHDVLRFGNLIRKKYGYGKDNQSYWGRYRAAIGFLSAYSGPITIYYGDEIGDITECYYREGDCGGAYNDNAARTNGQITNFDSNQQQLHDFTAKVMKLRAENPALYDGERQYQDASGSLYMVNKVKNDNKIQVLINTNTYGFTVNNCFGGEDLISGKKYQENNCYLEPFQVIMFNMNSTPPIPPEPEEDTFQWKSYQWKFLNKTNSTILPGPNYFSPENVIIPKSDNDKVTIKINKKNNTTYCSGFYLNKSLGYGEYQFEISQKVEEIVNVDKNLVFTFSLMKKDEKKEIGIDISKWGASILSNKNMHYVFQPPIKGITARSFMLPNGHEKTKHIINLSKDNIKFKSIDLTTQEVLKEFSIVRNDSMQEGEYNYYPYFIFWMLDGKDTIYEGLSFTIDNFIFIKN